MAKCEVHGSIIDFESPLKLFVQTPWTGAIMHAVRFFIHFPFFLLAFSSSFFIFFLSFSSLIPFFIPLMLLRMAENRWVFERISDGCVENQSGRIFSVTWWCRESKRTNFEHVSKYLLPHVRKKTPSILIFSFDPKKLLLYHILLYASSIRPLGSGEVYASERAPLARHHGRLDPELWMCLPVCPPSQKKKCEGSELCSSTAAQMPNATAKRIKIYK